MQTWPWFCYQSGLVPRIWSYYHLKDSLVNAEAFLTCPQPSFYFLSSNPDVDVLGSSNSEQNLESISFACWTVSVSQYQLILCVLCIYLSHIVLYQCNSCSYPWHVFQDHYKPLWCVFPYSKISIKGTSF